MVKVQFSARCRPQNLYYHVDPETNIKIVNHNHIVTNLFLFIISLLPATINITAHVSNLKYHIILNVKCMCVR